MVTSLLWKTGDLDLAVNAAVQLSKPGKDARAQARAEAGAQAGDDLVRAARELLGLQARLRGCIEHKQDLTLQIYQKEHPSHHQAGPAAPRAQMEDLDRFLQSLPPAEQPVALPAPARPDLRLSPAEQQARIDAEIRLARNELHARWLAHEQAHPILAAFRDADGQPAGMDALSGPGADPVRVVLRTALPKLVANRETRRALRSGELSPWALPRVVTLAQAGLGIAPGTLQARIVSDEARDHASGNTMAVAAIGLGLAVLAAVPTGGSSLALGAELSGLALEAYLAYDSIERHQLGTNAANTHIDRARALAAEEPSLGWLAVDLLGAGMGMGMAVKAMRDAAALRHAAQVAPEAIARLDTLGHARGTPGEHGAVQMRMPRIYACACSMPGVSRGPSPANRICCSHDHAPLLDGLAPLLDGLAPLLARPRSPPESTRSPPESARSPARAASIPTKIDAVPTKIDAVPTKIDAIPCSRLVIRGGTARRAPGTSIPEPETSIPEPETSIPRARDLVSRARDLDSRARDLDSPRQRPHVARPGPRCCEPGPRFPRRGSARGYRDHGRAGGSVPPAGRCRAGTARISSLPFQR